MFTGPFQIQRRFTVGHNNGGIGSRTGSDPVGILASFQQFLDCRRFGFRAGHQGPGQGSGRQIRVQHKHDIDSSGFVRFFQRFKKVGRISHPASVCFDTASNNSCYCEILVRQCFNRCVFHIRRRSHARYGFRIQTQPPGQDLHMFGVSGSQHFTWHAGSLFGIMVKHRVIVLVISPVKY